MMDNISTISVDLPLDGIRRLPPHERLPWVERVRIFYPQWHELTHTIQACHHAQAHAAEPPCVLLVGDTGVGKTTLLTAYANQHPASRTEDGLVKPVVQATILPPATVKSLASTLLHAIGDPAADRGTTVMMTHRLIQYFRDCHVELLILDELQHFVDRDSHKILVTVSNWLKTLIKATGVACVLVGLAGEAEQVVATNPQLARLFGDPVVLTPFRWEVETPRTIIEFRALLQQIEDLLPLNAPSHLANIDLAQRCFVASGGVLSYVMALLRRATTLALQAGAEQLDQATLAAAYDVRLGGVRRKVPNPFVGDLPSITSSVPVSPRLHQGVWSRRGATMR